LRTDCGRLFAIFILLLLVSLAHVAAPVQIKNTSNPTVI